MSFLQTYDGSTAVLTEELRMLYGAVYAGAPYYDGPSDVAEFVREWPELLARPGFRLVLTRVPSGQLVGFALGHVVPPDGGWWPVGRAPADDSFGLAEFGVHADWRRGGVGRGLHDALVAGRTEPRVVLWVHADAVAAGAAYRRWGYRLVGPASRPPYQVMCLPRAH